MGPAALLSVLCSADTQSASADLRKFDSHVRTVKAEAEKGIEARLGGTFDRRAFDEYQRAAERTARMARDRKAFRAELGADFSNAGFRAFERAVDKAERDAARLAASQKTVGQQLKGAAGSFFTGGKTGTEERSFARGTVRGAIGRGAGFLGGGLVGGLAGYVSAEGIKNSIESTTQLVRQAEILHHYTGMSTQSALQFQAVAGALGVSSKGLGVGFRTLATAMNNALVSGSKSGVATAKARVAEMRHLSEQMNSALTSPTRSNTAAFKVLGLTRDDVKSYANDVGGMLKLITSRLDKLPEGAQRTAVATKLLGSAAGNLTAPSQKAMQAFKQLGITQQDIKDHSKDLGGMLGLISDRLNKIPPGAQRTALAAKLLGRNWQELAPLLMEGSKGMDEQLKTAKALGVTLGGDPVKNIQKLHEAEINLKLAQTGLSVQFTQHVAPALIALTTRSIKFAETLRKELTPAFNAISPVAKDVGHWLGRNKDIVRDLVIAFAGLKILRVVGGWFGGLANDAKKAVSFGRGVAGLFRSQGTAAAEATPGINEMAAAMERLALAEKEVAAAKGLPTAAAGAGAAGAAGAGAAGAGGVAGVASKLRSGAREAARAGGRGLVVGVGVGIAGNVAGSAIGGNTGSQIKKATPGVSTYAGIGAALGGSAALPVAGAAGTFAALLESQGPGSWAAAGSKARKQYHDLATTLNREFGQAVKTGNKTALTQIDAQLQGAAARYAAYPGLVKPFLAASQRVQDALTHVSTGIKRANNVPFTVADRLSREMLRARGVNRTVVNDMLTTLRRLPPGARTQAANMAIGMAAQLEAKGELPKGSAENIRRAITGSFHQMRVDSVVQASQMVTEMQGIFATLAAMIRSVIPNAARDALHGISSGAAGVLAGVQHVAKAPGASSAAAATSAADRRAAQQAAAASWQQARQDAAAQRNAARQQAAEAGQQKAQEAAQAAAQARAAANAFLRQSAGYQSVGLNSSVLLPSQSVGAQTRAAQLSNALTTAQSAGNVGAQTSILGKEITFDKGLMSKETRQLAGIKRALSRPGLSKVKRANLQAQELAILQDISGVQSNLTGAQDSLNTLNGTGATGFDLMPGSIRAPTFYDVASARHHRGPTHHVTNHNTVNLTVTDASVIPAVVDTIDRMLGSNSRARLRAAGIA